jgi:hypothetical protein
MAVSTIYADFEKEEPAVVPFVSSPSVLVTIVTRVTCAYYALHPSVHQHALYYPLLSLASKTLNSHGVPHSPKHPINHNPLHSSCSLYQISPGHLTSTPYIRPQSSAAMSSSPVIVTPSPTIDDYRRTSKHSSLPNLVLLMYPNSSSLPSGPDRSSVSLTRQAP